MKNKIIVDEFDVSRCYKNGVLHNTDSAAVKSPDGIHSWYIEGVFVGSEIENSDGSSDFYINGNVFTKKEFVVRIMNSFLDKQLNNSITNKIKVKI